MFTYQCFITSRNKGIAKFLLSKRFCLHRVDSSWLGDGVELCGRTDGSFVLRVGPISPRAELACKPRWISVLKGAALAWFLTT